MQIGPKSQARAEAVRQRFDKVAAEVKQQDNLQDMDLDASPGSVLLSRDAAQGSGLEPVRIPAGHPYKDEVVAARLSFDPQSGVVKNGSVECVQYYDSSYGRSAESLVRYGMERTTEKGRDVLVYTQRVDEPFRVNNSLETVKVDAGTGAIVGYTAKEYAATFPQALKEVFTTVPGIGLTAVAGLLCGAPGTLTGVLFGPVAGIVAVGATAVGLAYAKTRPWSPHLPKHNE